jgi:hypothetical protein
MFLTQVMFDDWEINICGNALELLFAYVTWYVLIHLK